MNQSQNQQQVRAALRQRAGELAGRARQAAAPPADCSAEAAEPLADLLEELLTALAQLGAEASAAGLQQAAVIAAAPVGDPVTAEAVTDALLRLEQVLSDRTAELLELAADAGMVRDFTVEARDHLANIETHLLRLEQNPGDQDAVHTIFRGFHTIKGLASFLELDAIRDVAHEVETVLDRVRTGVLEASPALIDAVLAGADYLRADLDRVLAALEGPGLSPADSTAVLARVHALMQQPSACTVPGIAGGHAEAAEAAGAEAKVQKVSTRTAKPSKLESKPLVIKPLAIKPPVIKPPVIKPAVTIPETGGSGATPPQAPNQETRPSPSDPDSPDLALLELPGALEHESPTHPAPGEPSAVIRRAPELEETPELKAEPKVDPKLVDSKLIKVDTEKLDFLVDMVGELVIAQSMVWHDGQLTALASPKLQRNLAQLTRITGEVQKTAMSMRMVPIRQLFQKSARLVRDLTRRSGKQVELELSGEETELDRTIVEELSDPLMHMIRNACDHGVETPQERGAAGKPPLARIRLKAYHQSGHIVVEISDDGRGMDRGQLIAKARSKGLLPAGSADGGALTDKDAFSLIFEPGFSTAERVTDISGRGVGMDVVRKQIQKLRGRVDIDSEVGAGTTFLLKLPLTLAIIDGLVVGVGKERYIVPIFVVREIFRPRPEMIFTVAQRGVMVKVRGSLLPVIRLSDCFGVAPQNQELASSVIVVAEGSGKRFCLVVDELIGKQEVVIKSLGETFKNVAGVAGGAILGDGRVGLIIDMDGLLGGCHV